MSTIYTEKPVRSYFLYVFYAELAFREETRSTRSVLEYTIRTWQAIPEFLSKNIKPIQKRALQIIYPPTDIYEGAIMLTDIHQHGRVDVNSYVEDR